jgi:flagellar biogenesis protein FliO
VNEAKNRRRLFWLAAGGGVLVLSLLFITTFAPSGSPGSETPVIRTGTTTQAAGALSEADPAPAAKTGSGFSLGGGDAVSLAWRLALVVVIIAVSIVGLRWWGRRTSGPRSTTGFLRILDTLAISNGRTIHLVALGDRVIAVGATAQQLSYLNELNDDEAARVLAAVPARETQPIANFAAELFQSMRGTSGGTTRRSAVAAREEQR